MELALSPARLLSLSECLYRRLSWLALKNQSKNNRPKYQTRAFLPAGRIACLPRLARHSW
jgi:hypothetical protein